MMELRICLVMLGLLPAMAFPQSPLRQFDQFGAINGLDAEIRGMAQDEEGFYWLATNKGLFRFDGVQATKIHLPVADSLSKRSDNTYDLCFDPKNQLIWLGTDAGLFSYNLHTGASRHFHPKNYYPEKDRELHASHAVFPDRQGGVWAEFGRYGFAHLAAGGELLGAYYLPLSEKEKASGIDEKMANTVLDISQDPNHENILWMNTRRGLMQFDKKTGRLERFLLYPENERMMTPANSMTSHYAHPNGQVYIGTWNAGLLKFDPKSGRFSQFLRNGGTWKEATGDAYRVLSVVPDRHGNLWTDGTGGGALFDVKNERFTSPPVEGFNADFQDRDGNYWQFKSGLRLFHRLKNQGQWAGYSDGLPCEQLDGLLFDSLRREVFFRGFCNDGAFWAMNVDSYAYRRYPLQNQVAGRVYVTEQAESPSGYYLVENQQVELYLRPAGSAGFVKIPTSFPSNVGNLNMACSPGGDLFVTGNTGWLFWLKPPDPSLGRNNWETASFSKSALGGSLPNDFHCVSVPTFDAKGRLWLRTCRGFSVFSPYDRTFRHFYTKQQGATHLESYQFFLSDGQQRIWASGKGGFGWFDIERPEVGLQKSYRPEGTFSNESFILEAIIQGKLWLRTSDGWAEFDPEKETFRYFDFLRARQLVHLGEGRLLADEGDGFRLLLLDSLQWFDEMLKPYISWFKVFEKPFAMPGSPLSPLPVRLRPSENFFSVGFSALATYNTAGIRFAYQLEGVNPEWVYPEPGTRAASFTNIDDGDYIFKIKTTNSRGVWLDNVFELKIHVGTPWYKTWWFRLAALALLGSVVYFFVKNRLRQQQILLENQRLQLEKELSLRNERDRIAAEMHDDLGSGLSTIRFLSLAAREKEADPENSARIDKIAAHASQVMEKMADIIWVMNSRNDSLENFSAYLRRYAAEYLETHGLRFVMETEGNLEGRKLGGEQRRSLLSAIKECLHNSVKHAGASTVRLSIKAGEALEVVVQDDGKGLPEDLLLNLRTSPNALTGNGLRNLSQRMSALGGEAVFENGKGTTVRLRMGFAG